MHELLRYTFLQHALLGALLASVACGVVGTLAMERRLVMMSGGIAHTAFGGIGLGYYLHIEPILGALAVSLTSSLVMVKIKRRVGTYSELLIGMFWSLGMAMGIIFIALMPGYPPDFAAYLFGDILTVSRLDLKLMLVLDVVMLLIIASRYQHFKAFLFDEEFATVRGLRVGSLECLLYLLIAGTVVVLIRVVGIILVMALFTVPPAVARQISYDFGKRMVGAVGVGVFLCVLGLWLSYVLGLPSGAVIAVLASVVYTVAVIGYRFLRVV